MLFTHCHKWSPAEYPPAMLLKHSVHGYSNSNLTRNRHAAQCTVHDRIPHLALNAYLYFKLYREYKNINHQQTHKESFIINRNTLLHVSTLLGHLQGELFCYPYTRLHFIVEWECAVDCVLCTGGVNSLRSRPARLQKQRSTQSTAHSHSTIKCNLSVTITKKFSLKMIQQGRNM
jgi:hypothetical protein